MRRPIKFNFEMSQYMLTLSSIFLMFSIQTTQQLLCPNSSCECFLGGQEIKCDGTKVEAKNMITSLENFQSIETLRLINFKNPIDINIFLKIAVKYLIIKNSDIKILSILMNDNRNIDSLTLINISGITETWEWGTMFDHLSELKDFRLESSSLLSVSNQFSIKTGHGFKVETFISVSLIDCQIRSINGFNNWSHLKMISLAQNNISDLNINWFSPLMNSLWSLDLSYNQISSIPDDFFKGMTALKKLRLDNNSFKTLNYEWYNPIWNSLNEFWIEQNSIICSFDLIWITNTTKNPIFFDDGVCFSYISWQFRYFYQLQVGDRELDAPSTISQ